MTRQQMMDKIHSHGRFTGKPGLHRIKALMDALGNPQDSLKFVHAAGTNGKGSTCCMIAGALEQAGYKTGLFVSPFVLDFRERIQINKKWIPEDELFELSRQVFEAEKSIILPDNESMAEFEFITAVAFLYFAKQKCDIVVLETGLGGHYDATNIIKAPEVCVMTHIALDHMAVLGNTVEEIAEDKCHIVKGGTVLVCAPNQPSSVIAVLKNRCESVGAEYTESFIPEIISSDFRGSSFVVNGRNFHIKMIGEHQVTNAVSAYTALLALRHRGWKISDEAIEIGLENAVMPARQEIVSENPLIMIDGGHNPDGISALCRTLDTMLPPGGISAVLGMVSDKQYDKCIQMIAQRADNIYTCAPDTPRAVSSAEIAASARKYSPYINVFDCKDVQSAVKRALRYTTEDDVIIICGSLYCAAEAEKILRPDKY